jgi:shikimate kinase
MNADPINLMPNIYLVGFMGVGKSAIGKRLAHSLGFNFIDSDAAIENTQQQSIAAIFASLGEPAFRQMERDFIDSGHPGNNTVVSCGGGLVCQPGMAERLTRRGVVFCLFASVETIIERTSRNNKRPLLAGDDKQQKIRALLAEREPIYRQVGVSVSTDGRSVPDIVKSIVRVYQNRLREQNIDFIPKPPRRSMRAQSNQ